MNLAVPGSNDLNVKRNSHCHTPYIYKIQTPYSDVWCQADVDQTIRLNGAYLDFITTTEVDDGTVTLNSTSPLEAELAVNLPAGQRQITFKSVCGDTALVFDVKKLIFLPTNWVKVSSNVSATAGQIVTSNNRAGWNKGASFGTVPAGKDFELEFKPKKVSSSKEQGMFGMDSNDPNYSYSSIDYALYLSKWNLYVYENGSKKGAFGNYSYSDILKVKRTDSVIAYYKNDELIYTSNTPSTTQMVFDCSLYRRIGATDIKLFYIE